MLTRRKDALWIIRVEFLCMCLWLLERVECNNVTNLQQSLNTCLNEPLQKPYVEWQGGLTGDRIVHWKIESVCTSINSCYGTNLPSQLDTKLDFQQPPVFVQPGVQVRFNSSIRYNETRFLKLNFFEVTQQNFQLSDASKGIPLTSTVTDDKSLISVPIKIGTSYYLDSPFLDSKYGLRLMITVQTSNCTSPLSSQTCSSRGKCLAEPWKAMFTCRCCPGYNTPQCGEMDACWSNPCLHAGTCIDGPDTGKPFSCVCQKGYSGDTCDTVVAELCKTNQCLNQGVCLQGPGSNFTCSCPSTFTGARCETPVTPCDSKPCLNGGTCFSTPATPSVPSTYVCSCSAGFTGKNCESDIKKCPVNICKNGGDCVQYNTGPVCNCLQGFTGPDCSSKVSSLCVPNPCQNSIECVEYSNSFRCTCKPGFSGQYCNIDTDECASNPCNGGNCTDTLAGFVCRCPSGRSGLTCEQGTTLNQQPPTPDRQTQSSNDNQGMIIAGAVVGAILLLAAIALLIYLCVTGKACFNRDNKSTVDEYTPAGYTSSRVSTVSDQSAYERAMQADSPNKTSPDLFDTLTSRDKQPLVGSVKPTFRL